MEGTFSVDIELTNRCNAKCHFCPRDQTPHQGIMSPEVFEKSLERAVEFSNAFPKASIVVNLCGLGEPLLNRNAANFVRQVREAGFECGMSSNASLLDEKRGKALLEAGLQKMHINVGEHDDDYETVYHLPFQKTHDNVVRFAEMAGDQCEVEVVIVDHRQDKQHLQEMRKYWGERGIKHFMQYEVINRGGALFVDHMQFEEYPELQQAKDLLSTEEFLPVCAAPFIFLFIGYDGQYYLCCSDWKKEVPLGSVFETSFLAIGRKKLHHVSCREPICKTCNHDPVNKLTQELRSFNAGESDAETRDRLIAEFKGGSAVVHGLLESMESVAEQVPVPVGATRRRIPLKVEAATH